MFTGLLPSFRLELTPLALHQVENLVAQSSERQIAFTLERKHVQETFEDDLTRKQTEVAAKLPYFLAKFKPSQAVLSLRAQV